MSDALQLEVVTPEREVVREAVSEVHAWPRRIHGYSSRHTPLLSELGIGALSYQQGAQTIYVAILGGVVEVLSDHVTVLADNAERAEDIDVQGAHGFGGCGEEVLRTLLPNRIPIGTPCAVIGCRG